MLKRNITYLKSLSVLYAGAVLFVLSFSQFDNLCDGSEPTEFSGLNYKVQSVFGVESPNIIAAIGGEQRTDIGLNLRFDPQFEEEKRKWLLSFCGNVQNESLPEYLTKLDEGTLKNPVGINLILYSLRFTVMLH